MIIISLTDCPPKVRGDLSKWLCEINTGVYVGNVSSRVRDKIWERICENILHGRATMVFPAQNEQRFDFRVHNTTWEPVDFDGIKLMSRPCIRRASESSMEQENSPARSRAERLRRSKRIQMARNKALSSDEYVVIDVETTGTSLSSAQIIEVAALHVDRGEVKRRFSALISSDQAIPEAVTALTGITDELLKKEGRDRAAVLTELLDFMDSRRLVGHNVSFDIGILKRECKKLGLRLLSSAFTDTLTLARRGVSGTHDFKLNTLAKHFGIQSDRQHRAPDDCETVHQLYLKLKEIQTSGN